MYYHLKTDGSSNLGNNLPGISILLFDARFGEPSLDKIDNHTKEYYNTGIHKLIQNIE